MDVDPIIKMFDHLKKKNQKADDYGLRSLGLGLGLETFAKFLRVSVLVSVLDNLVSEKSLGFGKIWPRKKVSVSVSVKILVSSFSG